VTSGTAKLSPTMRASRAGSWRESPGFVAVAEGTPKETVSTTNASVASSSQAIIRVLRSLSSSARTSAFTQAPYRTTRRHRARAAR
jgi:hypothetical protein